MKDGLACHPKDPLIDIKVSKCSCSVSRVCAVCEHPLVAVKYLNPGMENTAYCLLLALFILKIYISKSLLLNSSLSWRTQSSSALPGIYSLSLLHPNVLDEKKACMSTVTFVLGISHRIVDRYVTYLSLSRADFWKYLLSFSDPLPSQRQGNWLFLCLLHCCNLGRWVRYM